MQITKTHKIIISAIVVIILLGIYITFDKKARSPVQDIKIDQNNSSTTSATNEIKIGGSGEYTVEQISVGDGPTLPQPMPNLDRPLVVSKGAVIAPEASALSKEKVGEIQNLLKKDAFSVMSWINLGIYQKQGGDYEGAVLSWKYAGRLSPTDYVSLGNLGDLYAYFIKDNGQAEVYYKQAISKGPTQAYLYIQLAEVYRDVFKDLDKAKQIITEGLSKIPNDPSLLHFQKYLK